MPRAPEQNGDGIKSGRGSKECCVVAVAVALTLQYRYCHWCTDKRGSAQYCMRVPGSQTVSHRRDRCYQFFCACLPRLLTSASRQVPVWIQLCVASVRSSVSLLGVRALVVGVSRE